MIESNLLAAKLEVLNRIWPQNRTILNERVNWPLEELKNQLKSPNWKNKFLIVI
jgi:hypothetical protein